MNIGIVFWPSKWQKTIKPNEHYFGVGIGGHFIFTKSENTEKIAPGIALHVGDRKGMQLFIGVHFMSSDKVVFPNGENSFQVPKGISASEFKYKGAGTHANIFVGINTEIDI